MTVEPVWRLYNDGAAWQLGRWIHEQRDFDSLPILGDALEEAGWSGEVILEHCRQKWAVGPGGIHQVEHVRGCWVVDRVLGLE